MSDERAPKRARTRVIRTLDFELLPDTVADHMIQHGRMLAQHKSSQGRNMPFHRPVMPVKEGVRQRYQITVHDFVGDTHNSSFTDMYIAGSHRHPEFFRELQRVLKGTPTETGTEQYMGLTLSLLNTMVTYLKYGVVKHTAALKADVLRSSLTPEQIQALPERFSAFTLPMASSFVLVVDTNVLRRPCYSHTSATVRWKYVYNCVEFEGAYEQPDQTEAWGSNVSLPQFARRYEMSVASEMVGTKCKVLLEDPWPYHVVSPGTAVPEGLPALVKESLAKYGVACLPLSHEHLAPYTLQVSQYLSRLMRLPDPLSLADVAFVKEQLAQENDTTAAWLYRNKKQFFSRHVHALTGRTSYGHYCQALKQLFQELEFLVRSAFSEQGNVWATTAEIILQY